MTNNRKEQRVELEVVNLDLKKQNPKGSPWKKARELEEQKVAEFLTIEDVYNKIAVFDNPRDKCLFVILYICAARVEEIVRYCPITWGKKKVILVNRGKARPKIIQDYTKKKQLRIYPGIRKEDITIRKTKGRETLILRIRNLKNKQKGQGVKLMPLPLDSEINKKFLSIIKQYIQVLEDYEPLFPIGKRRAEQIISKSKFNPHFLRKCRLTHLVKYHNFTDQKLKTFAGWTDSRPAKHYIRITWEDLVDSM